MNLAINAISAKRGGAATYLSNVLTGLRSQLEASGASRIVVWRGEASTAGDEWPQGVDYRQDRSASGGSGAAAGSVQRLWFDQITLPRHLRSELIDVLYSSANFGPLRRHAVRCCLFGTPSTSIEHSWRG